MAQVIENAKGNKYALINEELYKMLRNVNKNADQIESSEFKKIKNLDDKIYALLKNKSIPTSKKAKMYALIASEYLDLRERARELGNTPESGETFKKENVIQQDIFQPLQRENFQDQPQHVPEENRELPKLEEEDRNISPAIKITPGSPKEQSPEKAEASAASYEKKSSKYTTPPGKQTRYSKYVRSIQGLQAKQKAREIFKFMEDFPEEIDFNPDTNEIIILNRTYPNTDVGKLVSHMVRERFSERVEKVPEKLNVFLEALGNLGLNPNLVSSDKLKKILQYQQKGKGSKKNMRGYGRVMRWEIVK